MSSSSMKQAELRRLMKLQREKKEQQEKAAAFQQASIATKATTTTPPKSILRVKKSSPTLVVDNNRDKQPPADNLSSLLTGYDDSDEDSDGSNHEHQDEPKPSRGVSWPSDETKLQTTHMIAPVQREERIVATIGLAAQERGVYGDAGADGPASAKTQQTQEEEDETWKEFEALLGDEDGGEAKTDATVDASSPDGGAQPSVAPSAPPPAAAASTVDQEEPEEDETPSTAELEQASYEARIAKLRLKAAIQKRKLKSTISQQDAASLTSVVTDYTPELAYHQSEEEGDVGTKRAAGDGTTLTPLEILRQKRAKARKLAENDMEDY